MAANNHAEQAPPMQEKKEEKKQPSALENITNESWNAIKGTTNMLVGTGAIAGASYLFGLDGLSIASSFPIGGKIESGLAGKEFKTKNFRDEAITGTLFTPHSYYGIGAVKEIPAAMGLDAMAGGLVAGGLTMGALVPVLNAGYYGLDYLVKNKTFKGMGKYFKENYYPGFKKSLPLNIIASAAVGATYAMPVLAPYLFPFMAVANVLYRVLLSTEKTKEYKKLFYPSTYLPNSINPFYLLGGAASVGGKIYRGVTNSAYGLGSVIRSAIGALFKTSAAPSPAASPAPAVQH